MFNNNNKIFIFFTNNDNEKGGLGLENSEEIKQLKKQKRTIIFPYEYLIKIKYIIDTLYSIYKKNMIIYVDFCNSDLSLLKNLELQNNKNIKIFLKYKGYYLNDYVVEILSKLNQKINFLTTINDKQINELKIYKNFNIIKYWRISLIKNPKLSSYLIFEDNIMEIIRIKEENVKNFIYFFVGRKDENKNTQFLIKVFEKLQNDIQKIYLVLIGDEKIKLEYSKKNIINIKSIDNESICFLIKNFCDCLIVPSKFEGYGRVFIEAMYYNKICLFPVTSGLNEHLKNLNINHNFSFNSLDFDSIYQKMKLMWLCKDGYIRKITKIFKIIKKEITKKDLIKQLTG